MHSPIATVIFSIILFATLSCRKDTSTTFPTIGETGIYNLYPSSYKLKVEVENGLVVIYIIGAEGEVILKNNDASDFHKWLLHWDARKRLLWFSSGDIGMIAWDLSNDKAPVEERVTPDKSGLLEFIPLPLVEDLPESLKQKIRLLNEKRTATDSK